MTAGLRTETEGAYGAQLKNKEVDKVLLTDAESGVVFEIDATALREMHTRHGRNGDYSEVRTDFETFRVKEDTAYICMLATKEKNHEQKG